MTELAVHATKADLDAASIMLAAAFRDDPVQQWLFDGTADYDVALRRFFRFFVDDYFALGHLYVLGPGRAAGLWAPPDRSALAEPAIPGLLEMMGELIGDDAIPRLSELARSDEFHPDEPHFYLGILGVDPAHQSKGYGERMLEPGLAAADRAGMLTHLESSNPRNIPFYERHGFVVQQSYRCGGDEGPLMTMMTRQPR